MVMSLMKVLPTGCQYRSLTNNNKEMSDFNLKERARMITSSLYWGGAKTSEELRKLDWLKTTSDYGISMYLREAERYGWIKHKCDGDKPVIYSVTAKGRKVANEGY